MIEAKLANEFGNPDDEEYQQREKAFAALNKHVTRNPERVAEVMTTLALEGDIAKHDKAIAKAARKVLDLTNNGTQIGFDGGREAMWAEVFVDKGHYETAHDYVRLSPEDQESPEGIALRRKRGFHTLKVYAQAQIHEGSEESNVHTLPAQPAPAANERFAA